MPTFEQVLLRLRTTCIVAAVGSATAATALAAPPPVDIGTAREASRALTDPHGMGKFLDATPGSPGLALWTPFLVALSANDAVARNLDDAAIAAAHADRRTARAYFNATVIRVVAEGLRRVGDDDLRAARPLIAKFVQGPPPCSDESTQAPVLRGPLMFDDELKGLEPVLTRAVEAVNARRPPVEVDTAALEAARVRSVDRLDAAELDTLAAAFARRDSGGTCAQRAVLAKVTFGSAPEDAPLFLRRVLRQYVESSARPLAYATGQAIEYPRVAETALVTGTQRIRFTVDVSGRLKDLTFIQSDFVPDTVPLPDGTVIPSRTPFEAEVRAWLPTATAKYRPRLTDGAAEDSEYEVPLDWRIDDAVPPPPHQAPDAKSPRR